MIPRIQGKVGKAVEPEEVAGKWFFTILFSIIGDGKPPREVGFVGPFDDEEKCVAEMHRAVKTASEACERSHTGAFSGEYIDLKDNLRKKF